MRRLIVPILLFSLFAACSKPKGPANGKSVQPNNNLDSTVSIGATVNGVNWATDSAFGYKVKSSGNDSSISNLMITATYRNGGSVSTMTFNISDYGGPKAYPVNPPITTAAYYLGNNRHFGTKGTITITSDTAYSLKGTFNFTADNITVTNGVFNVALP